MIILCTFMDSYMRDFLPSAYKPKKMLKASKPTTIGSSHVLVAYEDFTKDEKTSNNGQSFESEEEDNVGKNHDGKALCEL